MANIGPPAPTRRLVSDGVEVDKSNPLPIGGEVSNYDVSRTNSLLAELIKKQDLTNRYLSLLTSANLGEQNDGT